jgi:ribosome maturation factor RimP
LVGLAILRAWAFCPRFCISGRYAEVKEVDYMAFDIEEKVRSLAEGALKDSGLELLDIEFKAGSLRITLDSLDSMDLDRIADASTLISKLIDASNVDELGSFTLEVSSPGVERTLRTEQHFQRFIGSRAAFKTKPDTVVPRRFQGVIQGASDGIVTVAVEDSAISEVEVLQIRIDQLERARTVFEWGASKPKAGSKSNGNKKAVKPNSTINEIAKD